MKRKNRTIIVGSRQYIWQYELGSCTILKFSPISDKTSTVSVEFYCKNKYADSFPECITMNKNGKEYHIKTISPRMARLILFYLSDKFITRKNIKYDGCELLSQMGFTIIGIKDGLYW